MRDRLVAAGFHPPRYEGRPGQRPMRRFSALSMALAVPGVMGAFTGEVPEEMWSAADWDAERDRLADLVAIVACPCGEEPRVAQASTTICKCRRAFVLVGDRILVAPEGFVTDDEE